MRSNPVAWALWSVTELGSKNKVAGMPEYFLFAWFGAVIGVFAAGVSIYVGYDYAKTIPVRWLQGSRIAALVYLAGAVAFSLVLYVLTREQNYPVS